MRWLATSLLGAAVIVTGVPSSPHASPQTPPKVDFIRDVRPILEQHCIECHGPDKQMNGLRLDRRHDAMRGGTIAVIGQSAAASRLYLRLIGTQFGEQMPKDGHLSPEEIETVKNWLDQGAEWPDAVSGDVPAPPSDPRAVKMIDALRAGETASVRAIFAADSRVANGRGPGGTTPLMYATLVGNREAVDRLLAAGANPNARNDEGATALMWAAGDAEIARRLVESGADVNARSLDARTPLMIAAAMRGSAGIIRMLLDRGADPNVSGPWLLPGLTPLAEAALAGDADMVGLLLQRGARPWAAGPLPLNLAMRARCALCVDALTGSAPPDVLSGAMTMAGPPLGPGLATVPLLRMGASPTALHPSGLNMLMLLAASEAQPIDAARALLERGVDVNATGPGGVTALALARRHGATPMVDLLLKAGATDAAVPAPASPAPSPAPSARTAVLRSLPLLQRSDVTFMKRTGCVSCHNNSLTAMTVSLARAHALAVDEPVAASQKQKIGAYLGEWRERTLQMHGVPGYSDTVTYILMGLEAERYAPDYTTDAMARFVRLQQEPDGSWHAFAHRPPIESSDIEVTAASIRALRAYAAPYERQTADVSIARAVAWLKTASPRSTEDYAFKALGLSWARAEQASIDAAARELLATQRRDGGWAQNEWMQSDAYATGQALVALAQSGIVQPSSPAFKRGAQFLVTTQLADGSWLVRTRALPIQPYFESDFPHGRDQFISAAATNWATQALIYAATPQPAAPGGTDGMRVWRGRDAPRGARR